MRQGFSAPLDTFLGQPLLTPFWVERVRDPTKRDYRKSWYQLIQASLLGDLALKGCSQFGLFRVKDLRQLDVFGNPKQLTKASQEQLTWSQYVVFSMATRR